MTKPGVPPRRKRRQLTAATAIRGVLVIQVAIAAILFGRDMASVIPNLSLAPNAPKLTKPVAPGDQRRRYDPRQVPQRPGTDLPDTGDMPSRLLFETTDDVLRLSGAIAPGDADRLDKWLEDNEMPTRVSLHSTGGSVTDALAIGERLRLEEAMTEIAQGDVCLSACPYMLAAGIERRVHVDGFVGVHQHYFGESEMLPAFLAVDNIQRGQAEVVDYLDKMGIDLRLMRHSLATPPDEIYILVAEELTDYKLATEITGQP